MKKPCDKCKKEVSQRQACYMKSTGGFNMLCNKCAKEWLIEHKELLE